MFSFNIYAEEETTAAQQETTQEITTEESTTEGSTTEESTTEKETTEQATTEETTTENSTVTTTVQSEISTTLSQSSTTFASRPAPTSITLNFTELTLAKGDTATLVPTVNEGSDTSSVKYLSSNNSVVSVSDNGKLTATGNGTAVVKAYSSAQAGAVCTVTVKPAATKVSLGQTSLTLGVGESFTFKPVIPENTACSSFTFSSLNRSMLKNLGGGTFKATKIGTTFVYVKTATGAAAYCKVTVLPAAYKITLNKTSLTLGLGESFDFNASIPSGTDAYMKAYSCSDSSVLTYKKSGIYTAKKVGTATVTVTTFNGKTSSCKVTVLPAATKVSLNATALSMGIGESFDFNASVPKGTAAYLKTMSCSNQSVLKYKGAGVYTALKAGTATVTVTIFNGKKASCKVTVLPLPDSISAESDDISMAIGGKKQIKIICPTGTACSSFTYKSSNSSIAAVDAKGVIQAKKMGSTSITVTSSNGKKCTVYVEVTSMGVPFVSQAPSYPTGCEAASCTQLLKYYGYSITLDDMVDTIPRKSIYVVNGKRYGPDINEYFVGNPAGGYTSSDPGYGAFSPCVTKALQTAINERGGKHTATKISGCSFDTLLSHISKGRPAIVWATYLMQVPSTVNSWYITETGKYFEYPRGTHVMVLTGYSDSTVTIVDPYEGTVVFDIDTFEARWNLLGKQAIVLL